MQIEHLVLLAYFAVLLMLCSFGFHRAVLVYHYLRRGRLAHPDPPPAPHERPLSDQELPTVTVQLPLYNEAAVVARLLTAVGRLDYPRDKLQIQVLDDSSDETGVVARAQLAGLRERGIEAHYLRRPTRSGYKAGALDFGLGRSSGELLAIFDADFVPQPGFLRAVVHHFADPTVGLVQTRWSHINRWQSLSTQVQALMLDGHHLVENCTRYRHGLFFNFSGTGGVWRKQAIVSAGGWQHDTLTEDLDLSYRAQLEGWRFVYRPDVVTPAELPEQMDALRTQQYRWAKGTVQTARKLLPRVWSAPLPLRQKLEAQFHLTPHLAYPLLLLLTLLVLPVLTWFPACDLNTLLLLDLPLFLGATGSLAAFYAVAMRAQGLPVLHALRRLPAVIALGVGLCPHLTRAVFAGLGSRTGEFVRTPKRGQPGRAADGTGVASGPAFPWLELLLGGVSALNTAVSVATGHWVATPFALLFTLGYGGVAGALICERRSRRRAPETLSDSAGGPYPVGIAPGRG